MTRQERCCLASQKNIKFQKCNYKRMLRQGVSFTKRTGLFLLEKLTIMQCRGSNKITENN